MIFYDNFAIILGRSSSVPPPRTESSRTRVRQYTDKLLSIQGAKYRRERSPVKQNELILAPIPEERNSFIEQHEALSELKAKNELLRNEFFKDLMPKNIPENGSLKRKKQAISASLTSLLESKLPDSQQLTQQLTPVNQFSREITPVNSLSREMTPTKSASQQLMLVNSLSREVTPVNTLTQQLTPVNPLTRTPSWSKFESNQQPMTVNQFSREVTPVNSASQQLTQQLTPVNPLTRSSSWSRSESNQQQNQLKSPSRSRSGSPMTFTSCVKVQYKPAKPLYGLHQFTQEPDLLVQNCSCGNQVSFDLSRSQSAAAIMSNSGLFHATPFYEDEAPPPKPPPPRPPPPTNYFMSLPRDWQELTRSSSYSAMMQC